MPDREDPKRPAKPGKAAKPAKPEPDRGPPRDADGDPASDELLGEKTDYVIIGGEPP